MPPRALPTWLWLALAALLLALAALVLAPPNQLDAYDQDFALLWGRQLAHGALPDYLTPAASTPHPLTILVGAVLSVLGRSGARDALEFLNLLAWGVVVVAVGAIFGQLLGRLAGVFAALAVIANAQIFDLIGAASADAFFVAPLLVAIAIEMRTPRRRLVLVLIAVAGLTRPEAWLLAGAYFLWRLPGTGSRERAADAAIVLAAPVVWMALDAIVTGNALFSLKHTQGAGGSPTGLGNIEPQLRSSLSALLDLPELVGAAVCALMLWRLRARRALVPAAVVVLILLGFAALGAAKLPMLPRYLIVPSALITGAAGAAVAGWPRLNGRDRAVFAAGAVLILVLGLTRAHSRLDSWRSLENAQKERRGRYSDLRATLARVPAGSCQYAVSFRFKSIVAYEAGVAPDRVDLLAAAPVHGLAVIPATADPGFEYGVPVPPQLASARTVAAGSRWRVVDAGCAS